MNFKVKDWSPKEAEEWFSRIESNNGKGEGYNIDWKEIWNFGQTGFSKEETNNTTQRAISGFANTYGGIIVFGFNKNGILKGVDEQKDIENHFLRKLEPKIYPHPPLFIAKYYIYKDKPILVIFIEKSQIPLQCDNGAYYYREQLEFKFMSHQLLESKFRRCFDEEKYLFLVASEMRQLMNYAGDMRKKLLRISNTVSYKISILCRNFLNSGDGLYNFYKENNLIQDYDKLSGILKLWCIEEMDMPKELTHFKNLKEDVEKFYIKLEEARANEKQDHIQTN